MSIEMKRAGRSSDPTTVTITDGVHSLRLVWSYDTIVAFRVDGDWYVGENVWGPTTGGHILDETGVGPKDRLPREVFERLLEQVQQAVWVNPNGSLLSRIEEILSEEPADA